MADISKAKIEISLVSDTHGSSESITDVVISGRRQLADEVYNVLSEKFHIIDTGQKR